MIRSPRHPPCVLAIVVATLGLMMSGVAMLTSCHAAQPSSSAMDVQAGGCCAGHAAPAPLDQNGSGDSRQDCPPHAPTACDAVCCHLLAIAPVVFGILPTTDPARSETVPASLDLPDADREAIFHPPRA